ncbi:hypothetical protein [Bacillus sp. B1-WWTP-T-0.5-Post-4]|uniref:hypothetical protein n=1 Tax=Bacillus sp. B1-WWTP-T-0.5-Post-4 TaxID=2653219 RepID=UPI001869DEB1|nr:hypothetical protein [Bacillus sp. B1-WWTP-T-0.5-Post-4]
MDRAIKTEAERIAKEAEGSAKKHTDEVTKQVEEALKQDAQNKADAAKQGALSEADNRILKARQEAEKNAKALAEAARKKAEENAAADAQNKANAAQKAATDRANAVKTEVENFAKNAGNITEGTLAAQRLHGVTISGKSAKIVDIDAGNINAGTLDASKVKVVKLDAESITTGMLNVGSEQLARGVHFTKGWTPWKRSDSLTAGIYQDYVILTNKIATESYLWTPRFELIGGQTRKVTLSYEWNKDEQTEYAEIFLLTSKQDAETLKDSFGHDYVFNLTGGTNPIDVGNGWFRVQKTFELHNDTLSAVLRLDHNGTKNTAGSSVRYRNIMLNYGDIALKYSPHTDDLIGIGAINAKHITANSIKSEHIDANAVNASKIAANAITTDKLHVLAKNLINNFTVTNSLEGWNLGGNTAEMILANDPYGRVVKSVSRGKNPNTFESARFKVEANKTYKVNLSMWMNDNLQGGRQYFGCHIFDKDNNNIGGDMWDENQRKFGARNTNPYFWNDTESPKGWRHMEAYILGCDVQNPAEVPRGKNTSYYFRMPSQADNITIRFYNGYYPTDESKSSFVLWHSPTITEVDSGAIVAENIIAGTLDANKVNVTNLNAANITSGTMTADRINGGTINAANTNIINLQAGNITSGTIDASKIAVTNMNAANITSGILNADRIGAKSISVDKMVIGDTTNLCPNPDFEQDGGWFGTVDRIDSSNASVPTGAPTKFVGKQTRRDGRGSDWFEVKQGDQFYISGYVASKNSAHGATIGIYFFDKDSKAVAAMNSGYKTKQNGEWQFHEGWITAPNNAVKAYVWTQINAFENFGEWFFTKIEVRRRMTGHLIVDGAISAQRLAANAVTADKVAANAITADKIAANAVNASKIAAGSITTDKIAAAGITADKITSGILDANKVQVRNLSAAVITSGTMSADRITGGTINANNTNIINLKAQNIAGGTINADNVEISNGRVTINKDGVTVTDANFLVRDARTGFTHTVNTSTNLLYDHSFETIKADGTAIGEFYLNMEWATLSSDLNSSFYQWARVGTPKMCSAHTYDAPVEASPFGWNAALLNQSNYVAQRFNATAGKQYTISFHAAKPFGGLAAGQPRLIIEHMKDNNVVHSETKDFAIPATPAGECVRYGVTVTAHANIAGGRSSSIRVRFLTTNANWCVFDGVQAVTGNRAAPYDAEDSLWKFGQNRIKLDTVNIRKLYGDDIEGDVVRSANFQVPYKQSRVVVDHRNGNVSFNAASGNVHLGNMNTNEIIADKVVRVQNGMSIRGVNENGVGIETSKLYRSWGGDIELNNAIIKTPAVVFGGNIPTTQDGTLWYGNGWQGLGFYVAIGGAWHTVSAGFGAG